MHDAVVNVSIAEAVRSARERLAAAPFSPSTREASLLLAHVLASDEATILAHNERRLSSDRLETFQALLERRLSGEPVAYLTGRKEFFGRSFLVDSRVLIPRPETEHVVETILELEAKRGTRLLDIGTGSGCIAITLALELPNARLTATDSSPGALAVATANRRRLDANGRVDLLAADLAAAIDLEPFDIVVSNPPYIAPRDAETLSPEIVRFEPHLALFARGDGTSVAGRLLAQLRRLRPGARAVLEIGVGQAGVLADLAGATGFKVVEVRDDYAGIPRVIVLRRERD